jgi:hypothetical protein
MKMNDLSGEPFPETERPQIIPRGTPEEGGILVRQTVCGWDLLVPIEIRKC